MKLLERSLFGMPDSAMAIEFENFESMNFDVRLPLGQKHDQHSLTDLQKAVVKQC